MHQCFPHSTEPTGVSHDLASFFKVSQTLLKLSTSVTAVLSQTAPTVPGRVRSAMVDFAMATAALGYNLTLTNSSEAAKLQHLDELNRIAHARGANRGMSGELAANVERAVDALEAVSRRYGMAQLGTAQDLPYLYALFEAAFTVLWHDVPGEECLLDTELEARISTLVDAYIAAHGQ